MSKSASKVNRKKARLAFVIVCALAVAVLSLSYGVRSGYYLTARLTPKLDELGDAVGGKFTFRSIRAMGFTGIVLGGVEFTPNVSQAHAISMESVTVYPALLGMIAGDLNASRVEIQGARAKIDFKSGSADRAWIAQSAQSAVGGNVALESELDVSGGAKQLPELICKDCRLEAIYGDFSADIRVPQERIEVLSRANAAIGLDYSPIDVCIRKTSPQSEGFSACFKSRISGISYGESLSIPSMALSDFDANGVAVRSLELSDAQIAQNDERLAVLVDRGLIDATIAENSDFSRFSGDYLLEFSKVEILFEKLRSRLGFGIELRDAASATAKAFGGYDMASDALAVTFEADAFDLAPLFRRADFSDVFRIDALPLSGKIVFFGWPGSRAGRLDIGATVSGGALFSKILARDPLSGIDFGFDGQLWINAADRTFKTSGATAKLGKLPFGIDLSREKNEDQTVFRLRIQSAGNSEDFIPSLPRGFAPMLTGYKLSGPYRAEFGFALDEDRPDDLALHADIDLSDVKTEAFDPRSDFSLLKNKSFLVRINAATVPLEIGPKAPDWVSFYDLPRNTAYAFVASEDGKFFSHNGFDLRAIRAGLIADIKAKKFVRGGSTISQQVVKNVFLNHDKTASRKFQEAFLTWQMEQNLSKLMIFELYLNLAHFAKDTYGIRAAAQYYFKKNVRDLTLRESLFLASILPNPIIFGGQFLEGKLSSSRLNKMINVGNALRQTNRIGAEEWRIAAPLIKEGKIR